MSTCYCIVPSMSEKQKSSKQIGDDNVKAVLLCTQPGTSSVIEAVKVAFPGKSKTAQSSLAKRLRDKPDFMIKFVEAQTGRVMRGGTPDLSTPEGRMRVIEAVVEDYFADGGTKSSEALNACKELIAMHGVEEKALRDRDKVAHTDIMDFLKEGTCGGQTIVDVLAGNVSLQVLVDSVREMYGARYVVMATDSKLVESGKLPSGMIKEDIVTGDTGCTGDVQCMCSRCVGGVVEGDEEPITHVIATKDLVDNCPHTDSVPYGTPDSPDPEHIRSSTQNFEADMAQVHGSEQVT